MRRVSAALVVGAVSVATALGAAPGAFAAPTPTPTPPAGAAQTPAIGQPVKGKVVCTLKITDLQNVTGMVAADTAIYVVEGGDQADPSDLKLWTINPKTCATSVASYGLNPVDPEDLAMGQDGAVWVADIGAGVTGQPNGRSWLTLEQITLQQPPATPWRVSYPSTGKFNAQAMLLDKNDSPIIFSAASGKSAIYTPSAKMSPDTTSGLPSLKKVGDFIPTATSTDTPLGAAVGNVMVTGAAKTPDGSRFVIRTYSDAYEYVMPADGDIVKAITTTTPNITPLPGESPGRAITYSADGKSFLTFSGPANGKLSLLSYTPYVPAPTTAIPNQSNAAGTDDNSGGGTSFLAKLTLSQLTRIVAAVGAVGLVLAIAGIIGIRRARRRRREEEEYDDYDDDYGDRRRGRRGGRRDGGDRYGRGGYDGYDDGGYADSGSGYGGYGQNGYAGQSGYAGYGASNGYEAGGYAGNAQAYGNEYAPQPGYEQSGEYGQGSYGGQGYGGGEYPGQQTGQDYGTYGGQQGYGDYGGQPGYGDYGQYGGQQPGGYEDDFDPLDPRRR